MQSPSLRHRGGQRPEMPEEEPRKVPRAHSETRCERIDPCLIQCALGDEAQTAAHGRGGAVPSRRAGCYLGATAQAWTKACLGGRRRGGEIAHVHAFCMRRRAHRPAIDSGGEYTDEHATVEARVPIQPRLLALLFIQVHVRRASLMTGKSFYQ
jgi:hypothetical protein